MTRIAVVGAGITGITAALRASRDLGADVTLYEASDLLGGHANTVTVEDPAGPIAVDTAFLVYNRLHYPRFVALLDELGVEHHTCAADMSASFVDDDRDLRYALLRGAGGLLCQKANVLRPAFWRIFVDLATFRRRARADVRDGRIAESTTLGAYLEPYSDAFRDHFVVPLTAAIWSLPDAHVLRYPARAILAFFENHGLLAGRSGTAWRTFRGGSRVYVDAFARAFAGSVRLGEKVLRVERRAGAGVVVRSTSGEATFDHVVLATHADTTLSILATPTPEERTLLGAFRYHPTTVTLHEDTSLLHPDLRLRASWNTVRRGGVLRITYLLNRVQPLATKRELLLTLGDAPIREEKILRRFSYAHPIFDAAAVRAQGRLEALDGGAVSFCGAWAGHGFHEDGVVAAERVIGALRARLETAPSARAA